MALLFSGRFAGESHGVIIRVFATTEGCVALRVALTLDLLDKLFAFEGLVNRVLILIPMNTDFPDCDCGLTRRALLAAINRRPWRKKVGVLSSDRGDPCGSLLNYGVHQLQTMWTAVIAPEAAGLVTPDTLSLVNEAANEGASVIGIRFSDLEEACAAGIIPNRLAFWRSAPLMEAGGFYPFSHPMIREQARSLFQQSMQGGEGGLTIMGMLDANPQVKTHLIHLSWETAYQVPVGDSYAETRLAKVAANKLKNTVLMCRKLKLDLRKLRSALI